MTDFLLELRSEEIPARMQAGARAELEKLFRKEMDAAGVAFDTLTIWSTPRRLALIAAGLPEQTAAVSEELKGPRTSAPPQALEGFLRKTGLTADQLQDRDGTWFAVIDKPGRATAEVLAEAIPAIIAGFSWPKSMRWGASSQTTESLRWVRPLSGIVALFGGEVVPCGVDGVASGRITRGHRFMSSGDVSIVDAASYGAALRVAHVIVDQDERAAIIRDGAAKAAAAAGLTLVADEGLVVENAGLTEWPVPLLGRFDEAFLAVPPEVIQLTARVNQKYFVCEYPPQPLAGEGDHAQHGGGVSSAADAPLHRPADGPPPQAKLGEDNQLANAFVCTANIDAVDGGKAIVAGNEKVLAARLADARFFWEQDQKKTLAEHAEKLSRITFHEKLGTVQQRQDRFANLVDDFQGNLTNSVEQARQAATVLKADLVTEMVGEFPELQGLMGGYYAAAEGLEPDVAAAIRDHYMPVGQSDKLPGCDAAIITALVDKVDSLVGFFGANLKPTGSKDPFGLRRSSLGIIRLITERGLRLKLRRLFDAAAQLYRNQGLHIENSSDALLDFLADRLKVQQREAGVRHDLIDAVFALGGEDDLVRLLARVQALQAFVETPDGTNLLAGYKRAANLLKSSPERGGGPAKLVEGQVRAGDDPGGDEALTVPLHHPADGPPPRAGEELALLAALEIAEPAAAAAVEAENFTAAMTALAALRAPIDAFFDGVMVNDPDPAIRAFRLALLSRFRDAVHRVADFSKIEG